MIGYIFQNYIEKKKITLKLHLQAHLVCSTEELLLKMSFLQKLNIWLSNSSFKKSNQNDSNSFVLMADFSIHSNYIWKALNSWFKAMQSSVS